MSRPKTKIELIKACENERKALFDKITLLKPKDIDTKPICSSWTTKDVIAHLAQWHRMMLRWYKEGMDGKMPVMPEIGYSWKMTPELNEKIYQDHKNDSWDKVEKDFNTTYDELQSIITKHTDKELFTKKVYPWTGTTSLGCYLISATCSHYLWANGLLKTALK